MRAFSNEGFMDLEVELMLLRRKKARGQNQTVQVIKARHMAELEQVKVHFTILENVKLVHIVTGQIRFCPGSPGQIACPGIGIITRKPI